MSLRPKPNPDILDLPIKLANDTLTLIANLSKVADSYPGLVKNHTAMHSLFVIYFINGEKTDFYFRVHSPHQEGSNDSYFYFEYIPNNSDNIESISRNDVSENLLADFNIWISLLRQHPRNFLKEHDQNKIVHLPVTSQPGSQETNTSNTKTNKKGISKKCFIVHGHNNELKLEVSNFITKRFSIEPIILHEKANRGQTIIEKFESHSDVDFAVALWTADDEGMSKSKRELKDRSRQNVLYETGFFAGKLGRQRVIVLYQENVELPSDLLGVVYIPFDGDWRYTLLNEIEAIYEV